MDSVSVCFYQRLGGSWRGLRNANKAEISHLQENPSTFYLWLAKTLHLAEVSVKQKFDLESGRAQDK